MIDCHIIFNVPTDREDWLAHCVQSLQHPSVQIHIHRFEESEFVEYRRKRIMDTHDPTRWIMFADPDDYAVQPGYNAYIEFLLQTDENVVWPWEQYCRDGVVFATRTTPHHLVALRGDVKIPDAHPARYFNHFRGQGVCFPQIAYCWQRYSGCTLGGADHVNVV